MRKSENVGFRKRFKVLPENFSFRTASLIYSAILFFRIGFIGFCRFFRAGRFLIRVLFFGSGFFFGTLFFRRLRRFFFRLLLFARSIELIIVELEDEDMGGIAAAEPGLQNTRITAGTFFHARSDFRKKFI